MKKILLELDGAWVLEHRGDDKLPLSAFVDYCTEQFGEGIKVLQTTLTECVLAFNNSELTCEELCTSVNEILRTKMNIDEKSGVATISVNEVEDEAVAPEETEESTKVVPEKKSKKTEELNKNNESLDEMINSLIGADEFKALINEINAIAPRVIERNTIEAFTFQSYLFAINDGCGLSTYLELFAKVLENNKLFKMGEKPQLFEEKLLPPGDGKYDPFEAVLSHFSQYNKKSHQMICVDISEWMTKLRDKSFRDFLLNLEDYSEDNIFVFRIPFVEAEVLERINSDLDDILFIRPISFQPLSNEEIITCGKKFLHKFGYSAENKVWEIFNRRIAEEKSDGRFYGLNTVNKVIREMIYRKQLSDVKNDANDLEIKTDDVKSLAKTLGDDVCGGIANLDAMIGMEKIKQKVEEIITQIELSRSNLNIGSPCLHMRFVGNPGTGKTTVARIVGQVLKESGVLRNGSFFEYSGRDFCGRYVGETAPKTASMCRDAYGSVLFIDEAYTLYKGDENKWDYGREALDTLIAEMENHRNDLVVIMSGYTDEMETLMKGNAGLESRMPYVIEFPNYTREQLYQIYMNMVGEKIECGEGFDKVVKEYFDAISDEVITAKDFSNARFVRNIFERTCAKAAVRGQLEKSDKLVLTVNDFSLAAAERSFMQLLEKKSKSRIGF